MVPWYEQSNLLSACGSLVTGTHADLGGSNVSDGLSLYPLQWMLKEAIKSGLRVGFQMHGHGQPLMKDISEVIFPGDEDDTFNLGTIQLSNGIEIDMWDLRECYQKEEYRLRINVAKFITGNVGYEEKPRRVFDDEGQLIGYQPSGLLLPIHPHAHTCSPTDFVGPNGSFIHPSVYMLQDFYPHLRIGQRIGYFDKHLQLHRGQCGFLFTEGKQPWPRQEDHLPYSLDHARILVCGLNGIGKSTLINRVFGIDIANGNYVVSSTGATIVGLAHHDACRRIFPTVNMASMTSTKKLRTMNISTSSYTTRVGFNQG